MAINAGVTSTAAREGKIDDSNRLARELMADSKALTMAVKCIRETLKTVSARGVDLKKYNNEILPYKIPSGIAGVAMKKLFAGNELTSRIMTLHCDVNDIVYGCRKPSQVKDLAEASRMKLTEKEIAWLESASDKVSVKIMGADIFRPFVLKERKR